MTMTIDASHLTSILSQAAAAGVLPICQVAIADARWDIIRDAKISDSRVGAWGQYTLTQRGENALSLYFVK